MGGHPSFSSSRVIFASLDDGVQKVDLDGIGWDGLLKAPSVPINLKLNVSIVVDTEDPIEMVKDV